MKIKKLLLLLAIACFPCFVLAESVADINNRIKDSGVTTLTLEEGTSVLDGITIPEGKTITIDLNGNLITDLTNNGNNKDNGPVVYGDNITNNCLTCKKDYLYTKINNTIKKFQ